MFSYLCQFVAGRLSFLACSWRFHTWLIYILRFLLKQTSAWVWGAVVTPVFGDMERGSSGGSWSQEVTQVMCRTTFSREDRAVSGGPGHFRPPLGTRLGWAPGSIPLLAVDSKATLGCCPLPGVLATVGFGPGPQLFPLFRSPSKEK